MSYSDQIGAKRRKRFTRITCARFRSVCIHVNRPASGGTVPHFHQMSRGPAKSADVPHFSKMVLLFFSLPIILHVCLATQQSDELRIKIGSKFARSTSAATPATRQQRHCYHSIHRSPTEKCSARCLIWFYYNIG